MIKVLVDPTPIACAPQLLVDGDLARAFLWLLNRAGVSQTNKLSFSVQAFADGLDVSDSQAKLTLSRLENAGVLVNTNGGVDLSCVQID